MRDAPFDIEGDYDFGVYLEYVQNTFLVYLEEQQVLLCENLGEFAYMVYQEIQADRSLLNNQAAMYERMIGQMNSATEDYRRSEFVLLDLDAEYETVLKDRAKANKWTELGFSLQAVLGSGRVRIQIKPWSKVIAWFFFIALLTGMVFVGVNKGFFLTATLCVVGLIAFAKIVGTLPCCVSESGISLKEVMDRRIERLRNLQANMSPAEVQATLFDSFASLCGQDPDSVDSSTAFPY